MGELKSCPFCGGEAIVGEIVQINVDLACGYAVGCKDTGCNAGAAFSKSEHGAIERWNTRPIEDAQAAEIERLRAALEEIAKAEGVFSTDHLTHAENCIKHMVLTAIDALDGDE